MCFSTCTSVAVKSRSRFFSSFLTGGRIILSRRTSEQGTTQHFERRDALTEQLGAFMRMSLPHGPEPKLELTFDWSADLFEHRESLQLAAALRPWRRIIDCARSGARAAVGRAECSGAGAAEAESRAWRRWNEAYSDTRRIAAGTWTPALPAANWPQCNSSTSGSSRARRWRGEAKTSCGEKQSREITAPAARHPGGTMQRPRSHQLGHDTIEGSVAVASFDCSRSFCAEAARR